MTGSYPLHSTVHCVVTGHGAHWVSVRTASGRSGTIDCQLLHAGPGPCTADSPRVGDRLTCVVLGYERNGLIRFGIGSGPGSRRR
ncbi:hypothetical protein VMT65_16100 [Nocardia sp. CDC153]|uniref:hypothetical protein n=1 Tax=Nocardia sp. CDC153 TaxID=3112167 RepID=UPI002DBBF28F|nr:hypothetical protein [Nocardia sp. CDC153]MEC3954562.1 hypothetical protein [Nocardia sp. CDC153]